MPFGVAHYRGYAADSARVLHIGTLARLRPRTRARSHCIAPAFEVDGTIRHVLFNCTSELDGDKRCDIGNGEAVAGNIAAAGGQGLAQGAHVNVDAVDRQAGGFADAAPGLCPGP